MKIEDKQITFPKTLKVKYSGKIIQETDTEITIEGEDEDSYFKIYSPFRGIAKLLLFENNKWSDAASGSSDFDFSSLGLGDMPMDFGQSDIGNSLDNDDEPSESDIKTVESENNGNTPVVETPSEESDSSNRETQNDEESETAIVESGMLPTVRIQTNKGTITLELYEDDAPNTVANFISLIESGFYNGLTFHRVISDFMIQGGCPQGTGTGNPGYRFSDEISSKKHDSAGILSMANSGPDTNGSQFFITHLPTPHLDGKHAVFGSVIEGMEVVNSITQGDTMENLMVLQKRDHEYTVQKL